jgi:hypothetical protein
MGNRGPSTRLDLFGTHLHLARSAAEWRALARRMDYLEIDGTEGNAGKVHAAAWVPNDPTESGGFHIAIFIDMAFKPHHDPGPLAATIAHEATHVALRVFEHVGEDLRPDSEVFCYVVGHVTQWVTEHCLK